MNIRLFLYSVYKPKEMNKLLVLSTFLLLSVIGLNAQTWKHQTIKSDFDGSYDRVSALGYGGSSPYDTPNFIARNRNDKLEIYISNLGYTGCDDNELIIVFDSKRRYAVSTGLLIESLDKDALFIAGIRQSGDDDVLTEYHLINEIMKSSKMSIRFISSCKVNDFYYRLDGSTSAFNKMLGNAVAFELKYYEEQKEQRAIEKRKREEELAMRIARRRVRDSILKIEEDSIQAWKAMRRDKLNSTKDSILESFFESPMVDGKPSDYKVIVKNKQLTKSLMSRNLAFLKNGEEFVGYNLKTSTLGQYRLMLVYIDKDQNRKEKYIYKSFRLDENGIFRGM